MGQDMDLENTEAWENLANAVIIQAVKDYRNARRTLKKEKDQKKRQNAEKVMAETMEFFHGRWIRQLTKTDPEIIIRGLEEEDG